ncbi:MAG: cation ABC transporter substrate-binding protein, partial [Spirochaetia bacterium]|nr:cation ABC transporter substrate-binding protein [Spirochaetia bacterium]
MRKVLIILLAVFFISSASADKNEKLNVYVSIMPQKYFAEKVGGSLVNVSVLVPSGTSPENF